MEPPGDSGALWATPPHRRRAGQGVRSPPLEAFNSQGARSGRLNLLAVREGLGTEMEASKPPVEASDDQEALSLLPALAQLTSGRRGAGVSGSC